MITAVDTSVLIAIAKAELDAGKWVDLLIDARSDGELVICDIVAAEYFAAVLDRSTFHETLKRLGLLYDPLQIESAQLAGRIFRQYRLEGGPREHLIPDFLIGAHALTQANRIAALDRGYLRRYFPRLTVIKPS